MATYPYLIKIVLANRLKLIDIWEPYSALSSLYRWGLTNLDTTYCP